MFKQLLNTDLDPTLTLLPLQIKLFSALSV